MGVRFECPNGHKLHVKAHLSGERGICPHCDSRFMVPTTSGGRVAPSAEPPTADVLPKEKPSEEMPKEMPKETAEEKPIESLEVGSSLNTSVVPPKPNRSSRRSRRQRAQRLTLILAAIIFVLTIVLIFVLR